MRRSVPLLLALVVSASACRQVEEPQEPSATPDRPQVKVALIAATPGPSESEATRAMQGARLAFDLANETPALPVEVMATAHATAEDPTEADAVMDEILADPSVVAAIVWPGGPDAEALRKAEGIAVVDLSPVGDGGSGPWSRLVATDRAQAEALAGLVDGNKACLAGDDGTRGTELVDAVARRLRRGGVRLAVHEHVEPGLPSYRALVDAVREAGCREMVWTGGAVEAATILEEASGDFSLVGSDRLMNEGFTEAAGDPVEGTIATCPCGDISDSSDLEVQRFVQEYQSRYGTAPYAYAAEGWDAAQLIMDVIADAGPTRADIAGSLDPPFEYAGLLRTYVVADDGESSVPVTVARVSGGTWAAQGARE